MNGITVHENKDDWAEIVKDAASIQRLTVKEIKTVLNQLSQLSQFTGQDDVLLLLNNVLNYYRTTGILENSTSKIESNVCYYKLDDQAVPALLSELFREVSYGKRVTLVINSISESERLVKQLKSVQSALQDGLVNLVIRNGLKLEPEVRRLPTVVDKQQRNPMAVFVVFRDSDYISAIESLPDQLNQRNYKNCLFLVQESQIKVVKELFDQLWSKLKLNGPRSAEQTRAYGYELVNYDLNTILDNHRDESITRNQINLLAFRDKFEAVKLLNHCMDLPFVSIWNRNPVTCSFLSENITTSNLFWFNSVAKYSPAIPRFDLQSRQLLPKELYVGDSSDLKVEEMRRFKVLENYLAKKPTKLQRFELIELMVHYLSSYAFPNQTSVLEYLNAFYHKLVSSHVSVLTHRLIRWCFYKWFELIILICSINKK